MVTKQKPGRRHDKRLADKENIFEMLPKEISVMTDTAFIGEARVHSNILIPKKKTRNHPLTYEDKDMNKLISSYRVLVEHTIGGLKRYQCMSEKLRNHKSVH